MEEKELQVIDFGEMWESVFGNKAINIDEEIQKQAHWLANKFSARNGYTSTEDLLLEMGQFVKNIMLDKYNISEDD